MNGLFEASILARYIETSPGMFVGPIAAVFGHVINFLFNIVYAISPVNSLGFTIVLMTIIFRTCLLPLNLKAQKSMMKMREIQPELKKINDKYGKTKDPEILKKANAERAALMAKHDANPLKGCLPMLLQMPLFFGLNFIMRQTFLYVSRLRDVYYELAVAVQNVPGYLDIIAPRIPIQQAYNLPDYVANATRLIPESLRDNADQLVALMNGGMSYEAASATVGEYIALGNPSDLSRILNRFTPENWAWLQDQVPAYYWGEIARLNEARQSIETFFGLNLIENSGWRWPTVLIPLLTGITMLIVSWLGQLRNYDPNASDQVKMQQKIMMFAMPPVMAFFTASFPVGVGIFWVVGQVYHMCTDIVLNKKAGISMRLPFLKKKDD